MLNCRQITRLAGDFLDRRLKLAERWKFLLHIAMCRGCRAYVEQMRLTLRALAGLRPPPAQAQGEWLARRFAEAFGRTAALAVCGTLLGGSIAFADPDVVVAYVSGVPHVSLEGSYRFSHFTIWRAPAAQGGWERVTDQNVLCLGECFVDDVSAEPGATYWYRFDLVPPEGSPASYGPYQVAISATQAWRMRVRLSPNPSSGPARVELALAAPTATPVRGEVRLHDLQGRVVARLFEGTLTGGRTSVTWDGRGLDGRPLASGVYLLHAVSDLGSRVTRVVRTR